MVSRTIAAVSTAPGMAGIAVVRISGPDASLVLMQLTGRLPRPRFAALGEIRDPTSGAVLDAGLSLWFPGPNSFTGEDLAELQIHGGRAVVAAVLRAALSVPGVSPAEPGEFTRRAFENGKLDLGAVEGLADLLAAETEAQRRQAYAHYQGRIGSLAEALRQKLVTIIALIEATIDFPDEEDVTSEATGQARRLASELEREVADLIRDSDRGERIRDGIAVAIAGPPNAGKSTLMNTLARRDVAIVSPVAGTTRDSLEVHLDLNGVSVVLIDTAGLRDSVDPIEREGVKRALARLKAADLVLWLEPIEASGGQSSGEAHQGDGEIWRIETQIDRGAQSTSGFRHHISALAGLGVSELLSDLAQFAQARAGGEPAALVRERHRAVFRDVQAALQAAIAIEDWGLQSELAAEHLRGALGGLGRATGRVGAEAILDVVFSSFCIGK